MAVVLERVRSKCQVQLNGRQGWAEGFEPGDDREAKIEAPKEKLGPDQGG
jgi:hypothetical protein